MKEKRLSLAKLIASKDFPFEDSEVAEDKIIKLQHKMLRVQQGVYHHKKRTLILFEGFDAAGKGGTIRRLTENLDPRGVRVHPFGPPSANEQGRHYLYRFWEALPKPGLISVFDRTWYGRVLVERVAKLTPKERWRQAYQEINELEALLQADGIDLIKIFLAISPDEQLQRFEERLHNPYKQWKLTKEDIRARKHWREYVKATDEMFAKTNKKSSPWHLIPADDKNYARVRSMEIVTSKLKHHAQWMEKRVSEFKTEKLEKLLRG